MKIRMCHCVQCKYARKSAPAQSEIRRCKKGARRKVRMLIAKGLWFMAPESVSVPYLG